MKKIFIILTASVALTLNSCRYISVEPSYEGDGTYLECELDTNIPEQYDRTLAKDSDTPGTDGDIYWEANDFSNKVYITYNGADAVVSTTYSGVVATVYGAYVTLDFTIKKGNHAEVILVGSSYAGNIKIYSESKVKLTLDDVYLKSENGPAINFQCKKALFLHAKDATENTLIDSKTYDLSDMEEDQKGCIFSEGPIVLSGRGILSVEGNYKHGISTDSYLWKRAGTNTVVNKACASGIKVKGANKLDSEGDRLGFMMKGGKLFARVTNDGGKALNCETNVKIFGGQAELYSTGGCKFVPEMLDVQKAAAIKADMDVDVYGGSLIAKVCGDGARAIRSHGSINLVDGQIYATASGKYYKYHNLYSKPRAIKADIFFNVYDGELNAASIGKSDYAVAVDVGKKFTNYNGEVYAYAYDDAFKVQDFEVNDGYTFGFSATGDAIDSDNDISFNGGINEYGAKSSAFDKLGSFSVNGGTVFGISGYVTAPNEYTQSYGFYSDGISGNTGDFVAILDGNETVFSFKIPRSRHTSRIFYSSDMHELDSSLVIYKWGDVIGPVEESRILIGDGSFTGGYFVDKLNVVELE